MVLSDDLNKSNVEYFPFCYLRISSHQHSPICSLVDNTRISDAVWGNTFYVTLISENGNETVQKGSHQDIGRISWYVVLSHSDKKYMYQLIEAETNGRHFADDIFKCIFMNENVWIPIKIPLKFVPKGPINNIPALVQIMAWRRPGDKPLSEPMMVSLPTHICVTRPQWVKSPLTRVIAWCRPATSHNENQCQGWF